MTESSSALAALTSSERIKKQIYKNRELAAADVADYIVAFYNRSRHHGHLGGVSPERFKSADKARRPGVH
jgi:MoxR-like ATPase